MTRITVDEFLFSKLHNFVEPLELCDSTGRVLGRLTPAADLSKYEPWVPDFSDEELRQQELSDEESFTTEELLSHLKSLESR